MLPFDLAPTFRGQFAKYTYKLTIGVQKLNRTTQLLRLPFKVYSLLDFDRYIPKLEQAEEDNVFGASGKESIASIDSFDSEKFQNNPFKIVEKNDYQNLEYALQILEDLTARNIPSKQKRFFFLKNRFQITLFVKLKILMLLFYTLTSLS